MIAYLDCFSGLSGDMLLGALVDVGLPLEDLRADLARLPLEGYTLSARQVTKQHLRGTQVTVEVGHSHHHRGLREVGEIITVAGLPAAVTEPALRIFARLAEAEAKVHGVAVEEVHFHEVGAVDAIVDVVGACIGLHRLGITELSASPLPLGGGWVQAAHGKLPVPAPATVELLRGVPSYGGPVEEELVTPTGAAIVSTLGRGFGPMPPMRLASVGWGAGTKDLPHPNLLRLFVGEPAVKLPEQHLSVIETNVDDLNPEFFEHVMERLFAAGALEVYLTPILMKKSRPGTLVSVLGEPAQVEALSEILFRETSTLGVRVHDVARRCLEREWRAVETEYGPVRVKLGRIGDDIVTAAPEYEECKRLARERGVPVKLVYAAAQRAFAASQEGTEA